MRAYQLVPVQERRPWYRRALESLRSFTVGPYNTKDPALSRALGGGPTAAGMNVDEYTALNLSAVWSAVNIISSDIAALPLHLFRRQPDGGKEHYLTHPLYDLLHSAPNREMSSYTFRQALQSHVLTWGNGYAEIERDGAGRPVALWPLTPERVMPYREPGRYGRIVYRVLRTSGGDYDELRAEDVLHIHGLGYDGICGYSVITKARESLGLSAATERFGALFFSNGSTASGILQHPGRLSDPALGHLRDSLKERHSGAANLSPLILEEGMTWQQLTIAPENAQFLGTRVFQLDEIARWFNIPPHKLKELSRATFSNISDQGIDYVTGCLTPWLVNWEQELDRKLIRPLERRQQYTKHNVDALLRGNFEQRSAALAVGRQWGWYSINDIRLMLDMNPIGPQGDIYLTPANMADSSKPLPASDQTAPVSPAQESGNDSEAEAARHAEVDAVLQEVLRTVQQPHPPQPDPILRADLAATLGETERLAERLQALEARIAEVQGALQVPTPDPLPAMAELRGELAELVGLVRALQPVAEPEAAPDPEPPAPEPEPEPIPTPAARERARLITGHRAAIEDALGRLVRRETLKARRAAKAPDRLRAWIAEYYPRQQAAFESILGPAVQAHLGLVATDRAPGEVIRDLVAAHIEASRSQLHALLDSAPADLAEAADALFDRWQRERPAALADALMEEELAHVRA